MAVFAKLLRLFYRSRGGNVAILTALMSFPLVGMVGLSVDYAVATMNKSKLDSAADAAAIAAITAAQTTILNNSGVTGTALTDGQSQGVKVFNANVGAISFGVVTPTASVSVTRSSQNSLTAQVSYTAANSNSFGRLFGNSSTALHNAVSSSLALKKFINIYVVVDISNSMGIAATPQDMTNMFALTGCVFGCHSGNEQTAHSHGVTLRIDVMKAAIANLINQASALAGSPPTTEIGLYTLETSLTTLSAPTTSYSALIPMANALDLGSNGLSQSSDTSTTASLGTLASIIPPNGDGSSAAKAENFVWIMTDGTYDTFNSSCPPTPYSHCIGPYSNSWNSIITLKQNATVGVIYTTYFPIYKNNDQNQGYDPDYQLFIYPIQNAISPGLQGCTTDPSKWFIEASSAAAINTALNTFLTQAMLSARLIN